MGGLTSTTSVAARVLKDADDIAHASVLWEPLPAPSGTMGSGAWVRAWLEVYRGDYRPVVVTAGPPDAIRAVFPLAQPRRRPWFLEVLGVRSLFEPTDVRGVPGPAVRAVAQAMIRRRRPLLLQRMPADSALVAELRAASRHRALFLTKRSAGTPVIGLDDSWRTPESHFSARRRQDFRAARRRAEKLGAVELAVTEPAPEEAGRLFDEFVAVEASGWKAGAGTALASQPQMREFYRRFCQRAAQEKSLRFGVLRIDGRPVAMQLATEYDGRYSLFKIGFDEEFAHCSPGNLLLLHSVAWAANRGLRSYELLGAEEPWTAAWTTDVRPCLTVLVYPLSLWSIPAALEVGLEMAGRALKKARQRLRIRSQPG